MVTDNYSPSSIYSASHHIIDWMRQRSAKEDILTSLYSGSGMLAFSLNCEDSQYLHQITAIPSREGKYQGIDRAKHIVTSLDKGTVQGCKHPFRPCIVLPHVSNADNICHAVDFEKTRPSSTTIRSVVKKKESASNNIQNTPSGVHNNNTSKRVTSGEHPKAPKDKKADLYKTEMCRNWQEIGYCRYGKKCRYAHGHTELRVVKRHQRYKTEVCRTYHQTGTCPYGVRCTFIHDEKSSANPNIVFLNEKRSKVEKGKTCNSQIVAGTYTVPSSPGLSVDSSGSSSHQLSDHTDPSFEGAFDAANISHTNNAEVTAGLVTQNQLHLFEEHENINLTDNIIKHIKSSDSFEDNSLLCAIVTDDTASNLEGNQHNAPRIKSIDSIGPKLFDYFAKTNSEDAYHVHRKPFQKNASKEGVVKCISTRIASSKQFSWQTSDHRHSNIV
ncbi:hypothetical protein BGW37DRAFT_290019 [Umbelopsis sp. PMI_123]|nr:hypothetical protein BGW37DRAFT_290019 [Umbelopsis sp. PMI_123]